MTQYFEMYKKVLRIQAHILKIKISLAMPDLIIFLQKVQNQPAISSSKNVEPTIPNSAKSAEHY